MSATTIDIKDHASAAIQSLIEDCRQNINPTVGRAAVTMLKDHLRGLDATRANKLGGRRTHFYNSAAKGTFYELQPDGVKLGINQVGIRQRYYGGTITAGKGISHTTGRPTQFLTIPAIAEAYGQRASKFAGSLRISLNKERSKGALVNKATGTVYYWLVKSVTQKADPTILPTDAALSAHILTELDKYFKSKGLK
jgi:hypothetical protein